MDVAAAVRRAVVVVALEAGLARCRRDRPSRRPSSARKARSRCIVVRLAARVASASFSAGIEARQRPVEAGQRRAGVGRIPLRRARRVGGAPGSEAPLPFGLQRRPALDRAEALVDAVGHDEVLVGIPAEHDLRRAHLVLAERRAVRAARAALVRRRKADHGAHADQRRTGVLGCRGGKRDAQRAEVVRVLDALRVPAVGTEAHLDVLGRSSASVPPSIEMWLSS